MTQHYANTQPSGFENRIEHVAIVGATGQLGKYIAQNLLRTGKHTVTALTRPHSQDKPLEGIKVVPVDYNDDSQLVAALQGKQCLVITLSVVTLRETHDKLIDAAAKAGVPYVIPNAWGTNFEDDVLVKEMLRGNLAREYCARIEATGVSSFIAPVCGLWYEYSLASGPMWFGFDFKEKKLTLYDDGNTKINVTTWEQCGRAITALLSLKMLPEDESDESPTVSRWRNKPLYIASFLLSQRDMFDSWKRVSGDKDEDWTIEHEPSAERYKRGVDLLQSGDRMGLAIASFVRVFYPNGDGNHESSHGLANDLLGLPKEDLDERTKFAEGLIRDGYDPMVRIMKQTQELQKQA